MEYVCLSKSNGSTDLESLRGLERHGIVNLKAVHWNLPASALYEEAIRRGEGTVVHEGPLVVHTGQYTGRSPRDKFIVHEASSADRIWWGAVNRPMAEEQYDSLKQRMLAYLQGKELFVQDAFAGAEADYRFPIRAITERAWHSLFARNLFILPTDDELRSHNPKLTIIYAPGFQSSPEIDGTNSGAAIVLNLGKGEVLIAGTSYAGEMKKSVFSSLNYLLPLHGVLPMHCSANTGPDGDVAIFFGLSGTGKTTLSTASDRTLIGDDEHGWSNRGVFNFEGGCYAKMINLSPEAEPEIHATTRRFGTVLENVVFDTETRRLDLNDDSLTENTRGAYPISFMPNASSTGVAGHPSNVILLTADAFGVLPPVAKLTLDQAVYYFLSGYTAKVAGTERGIVEPEATFSPCFGAPFMAHYPSVYGDMLREKIQSHGAQAWLVNTGWTGGAYGVGHRMKIAHTRALLRGILSGSLADSEMETDPIFGLQVPKSCPDVPPEVLSPRATWADKDEYDRQARKLVEMFAENFRKFEDRAPETVGKARQHTS
jgi:phosphoenolpyruvate carboxykinase (ATP)